METYSNYNLRDYVKAKSTKLSMLLLRAIGAATHCRTLREDMAQTCTDEGQEGATPELVPIFSDTTNDKARLRLRRAGLY